MTARRTARTMIPALAAGVLVLAGCGASTGNGEGGSAEPTSEAAASDGGGGADKPSASEGGATGPAFAYTGPLEKSTFEDDGDNYVMFRDEIQAALTDAMGYGSTGATCRDDLGWVAGESITCTVTGGLGPDENALPEMTWTAYPVLAPGSDGAMEGQPALVFVEHLDEVTEPLEKDDVEELTAPTTRVVGIGAGSMALAEDIPADQLEVSVKDAINAENGYAPSESKVETVTCDEALVVEFGQPVDCDGVMADGARVDLAVYPASYIGQDPGLLVAIEADQG